MRTVTRTEEWEERICECGHTEGCHVKTPRRVVVKPGEEYVASGCMNAYPPTSTRRLEGVNWYPRCPCTHFH